MTLPLPDLGIKIVSRLFLKAFFSPEMAYFDLSFQNHQYMILPTKDFFFGRAAFQKAGSLPTFQQKITSPPFVSMRDFGI